MAGFAFALVSLRNDFARFIQAVLVEDRVYHPVYAGLLRQMKRHGRIAFRSDRDYVKARLDCVLIPFRKLIAPLMRFVGVSRP